jgi:hypothetical protein
MFAIRFNPGKARSLVRFQRIAAYLKLRRARPKKEMARDAPAMLAYRRRAQLRRVFDEQGGICLYCQCPCQIYRSSKNNKRATREHLVRVVDGGSDDDSNIVMACADCNHKRGNKSVAEWKANRRVLAGRP